MNFRLAYDRLCKREKAKNREDGLKTTKSYLSHCSLNDGKEVHHILPKILGGRNIKSNFVALSYEIHVYAHVLLNLAFLQEGNTKALALLGYRKSQLPMDFILKQRAMRGLKVSIPIEGKRHPPVVLGILEAAKHFCFMRRKNFNNKEELFSTASIVLQNAIFGTDWFGMKMKLVFDC